MGHNILNLGSSPKKKADNFKRFEELMAFVYYDFADENKYFQITIDGEDYLYKIYAAGFIKSDLVSVFYSGDNNEDELQYQINDLLKHSIYDYDVDVNVEDSIATLITCTRFFGSQDDDFFVSGRLVRKNEKISDYNVKKNDNYNKVEKIMKGDENDEEETA